MSSRFVFLDTSGIYPIFSPNEHSKELCRNILKDLLEVYNANLITTNWIHYEVLSKLRKHGLEFCIRFEELIKKGVLTIHKVDKDLETKGVQMFWAYKDKSWGVIDCVSFSFMHQKNIFYSLTMDDHFLQAGFYPLIKIDHKNKPYKSYSDILFY